MSRLLLSLLLLCCGIVCRAQPFRFEHFGLKDGLSNSNVECIAQDRWGFLWIGTQSGLNRFDGYTFKVFKSRFKDTVALSNNWITVLHTDTAGQFWIATRNGLNLYRPETESFSPYKPKGIRDFFVSGILEKSGSFWLSTNHGLWVFRLKDKTFVRRRVFDRDSSYFFTGIDRDAAGQILLGSYEGMWIVAGAKTLRLHISTYKTTINQSDLAGNFFRLGTEMLVLTWGKGLFRYQPTRFVQHLHQGSKPKGLPNDIIKAVADFQPGTLLLGTFGGGICVADTSLTYLYTVRNSPSDPASPASDFITALFRDRQGIFWIGTDKGLDKYDPLPARQMQILALPVHKALQGFNDVVETAPGIFWMASYGGLFCWNQQSSQLSCYNRHLGLQKDPGVFSLLREGNTLWVGGQNALYRLRCYNEQILSCTPYPLLAGGVVNCIFRNGPDELLMGSYGAGVQVFHPSQKTAVPYRLRTDDSVPQQLRYISAFFRDSRQRLWIASNGYGLACHAPGQSGWTYYHPDSARHEFPDPVVLTLAEDRRGNLWAGTLSNGLVMLNADSNHYRIHDVHNGFPASRVDVCEQDAEGHFWLLTDRGLVSFIPENGQSRLYTGAGFPEPNVYLSTLTKGADSSFYIGDKQRLLRFFPAELLRQSAPPQTLLTGFRIFNESQPLAAAAGLSYNQNYFTFDFTGIDFHQPEKTRYQYRMDGVDRGWVEAGTRRVAAYANLSKGDYIFRVRAANADGVWDATPASMRIIICPPFWRTWWFYLCCALLAAGLLYLAYRIRVSKLLALQKVRNRIARDLHDDVGSTLSSINILSAMAESRLESDRERATDFVQKIAKSSRNMMQNMRDIVWAVNPEHDSMEHVLSYMRQYLATTLEAQDIGFTVDIGKGVAQLRLDVDRRRDFYLVFKEAVNNCAKYSGATEVNINLLLNGRNLRLSIRDNGCGFDVAHASTGNGIGNMKQRAAALKGQLFLEATAAGTTVALEFRV